MIVLERRASSILFNTLKTRGDSRPFLLPGNVCQVVIDTYGAARQKLEFVDISASSLAMNETECLDRVRAKEFSGIHYVRAYGSEYDPSAFFMDLRIAQADLLIIDDKCLCRPDCNGDSVSPIADITLFSTGRAKFTDVGGGGFAYLADDISYERQSSGPEWLDLAAPVLTWDEYRSKVRFATRSSIANKLRLNAIYSETIRADVQYPAGLQQWRFNIRVSDSSRLIADIFNAGLFASRHFAPRSKCRVATAVHSEIVNLFNDYPFTEDQARATAQIVIKHLAGRAVLPVT
jgi:hypothetical protein